MVQRCALSRNDTGRGKSSQDCGGKAGGRGSVFLIAASAEDFVHRAKPEPAIRQGGIDRRHAERQDAVP